MSKKWEYLVVKLLDAKDEQEQQAILVGLGKDGWELVAVITSGAYGMSSASMAYLKREIA